MTDEQLMTLAEEYQTPMHIFDMDVLKKRVAFLKNHLPAHVSLCYAVKANAGFTEPEIWGGIMNMEKSFLAAGRIIRLSIWDIGSNLKRSSAPWRTLRASAEPAVFLMRRSRNCMAFMWAKSRKRNCITG